MSFKAWTRANAPKAYKPPKQLPKDTGPVFQVPIAPSPTAFRPGEALHYYQTSGRIRYGRFLRNDGSDTWAYFGDTPEESLRNTLASHTCTRNIRPGWPNTSQHRTIEAIVLADEHDEWDGF